MYQNSISSLFHANEPPKHLQITENCKNAPQSSSLQFNNNSVEYNNNNVIAIIINIHCFIITTDCVCLKVIKNVCKNME